MGENGKRIGLALSGGGYRAAAYHLGTLRALHKMGLLEKVDVISSVSGGSIIAAFYLLHKDEPFEQIEQSFRKCLAHSSLWGAILNLAIVFYSQHCWGFCKWVVLFCICCCIGDSILFQVVSGSPYIMTGCFSERKTERFTRFTYCRY